ncbi:hypothetical protein [Nocardia arthritidis]|uniref:Antitoxin n=1 Tax=Nocardia arthritidis TaxID=228602 RepID=A0A6G9YIK5_9NOCA|nr:hypothetical protein [Nocardia arthritidis]QIS13135.1 hypothetical protein F5544_26405 [Nocardia arthritidis]
MATIRIDDVPEEVVEVLRTCAAEAGMSLSAYLWQEFIAMARRPPKSGATVAVRQALASDPGPGAGVEIPDEKAEAFAEIRKALAKDPESDVTGDFAVETLRELRGE